jgi:hypothetical protein
VLVLLLERVLVLALVLVRLLDRLVLVLVLMLVHVLGSLVLIRPRMTRPRLGLEIAEAAPALRTLGVRLAGDCTLLEVLPTHLPRAVLDAA